MVRRIGVLRDIIGEDYGYSLKRGGDLISHIFEKLPEKYKAVDILVDKDGVWHAGGIPIAPADLPYKVNLVWNLSKNQSLALVLRTLSIPHISNEVKDLLDFSDRSSLEEHLKKVGAKIPKSFVLPLYQEASPVAGLRPRDFDPRYAEGFGKASGPENSYAEKKAKEIWGKFPAPWVVKSFTPDSNMASPVAELWPRGVHIVKTFPELVDAIQDGVRHKKSILVEEFISGRAGSAHSVSGFRGQEVYVLAPDGFPLSEKEKIISLVKSLHKGLGARHYLKTDFVLHPKKGFFVSNLEFLPDFRIESHFGKALKSVGAKMHQVTEHILENALNKGL